MSEEKKEVTFTLYEQRVFEIKGGIHSDPEAIALRKMIDTFPWLTLVAECRFDPGVASAAQAAAWANLNLNMVIDAYHKKGSSNAAQNAP